MSLTGAVMRRALLGLLVALAVAAGCAHVDAVQVKPGTLDVGPGLRPIAVIHATGSSFYFLWLPIPGVELDEVHARLLATANAMGADRVVLLSESIDSCQGFWCFWKVIGYRQASATGIAVQVVDPASR